MAANPNLPIPAWYLFLIFGGRFFPSLLVRRKTYAFKYALIPDLWMRNKLTAAFNIILLPWVIGKIFSYKTIKTNPPVPPPVPPAEPAKPPDVPKTYSATPPFNRYIITGSFGVYFNGTRLHNGVDLKPDNWTKGDPAPEVFPIGPGSVEKIGSNEKESLGYHVVIKHQLADGRFIFSTYGHLAEDPSQKIKVGDPVSQNDPIGLMGDTGSGTGHHLHLTIHEQGKGSYKYYEQRRNPEIKPDDLMKNTQKTYRQEMEEQWIDPTPYLKGEKQMEFVPL